MRSAEFDCGFNRWMPRQVKDGFRGPTVIDASWTAGIDGAANRALERCITLLNRSAAVLLASSDSCVQRVESKAQILELACPISFSRKWIPFRLTLNRQASSPKAMSPVADSDPQLCSGSSTLV
jgi:hypothetical protein